MCSQRTLKGGNIEKIRNDSASSEEISAQNKLLVAAERNLQKIERNALISKDKVIQLRARLDITRAQHESRNTKQTERALKTAKARLQKARQVRDKLLTDYREHKLIVRDQRNLLNSLEKKEVAKQKAVAKFLKEWERDYDRKMRMKENTIQRRKRLINT
jgi:hypothetical protein